MRTPGIIFTLLLMLFSSFVFADLILKYDVLVEKENPLVEQSQVLPQSVTLYINDQYAVYKETGYNLVPFKRVFDRKNGQFMLCTQNGDKKVSYRYEWSKYLFEVDTSTVQVLGYPSQKAISKSTDKVIEVYFSDPYGVHFFHFGDIKGLPIMYTISNEHFGKVIYKLSSLNVDEVPASIFDTDSYTLQYRDDLEQNENESKSGLIGKEAPTIKFKALESKNREIYDWKGKITIINFWFIACPPCIKEIPLLNQFVDKYKNNPNIRFLAITFNNKEELKFFRDKFQFDYEIIPYGRDIIDQFQIKGYPNHLLVNPDGIIVSQEVGNNPFVAENFSKLIEDMLLEKP